MVQQRMISMLLLLTLVGCTFGYDIGASNASESKSHVLHLYQNGTAEMDSAFEKVYNHFDKT